MPDLSRLIYSALTDAGQPAQPDKFLPREIALCLCDSDKAVSDPEVVASRSTHGYFKPEPIHKLQRSRHDRAAQTKAAKHPASKPAPQHPGSGSGRFHKERRPVGEPVSYPPAHPPRFVPVPFDPPANLTLSSGDDPAFRAREPPAVGQCHGARLPLRRRHRRGLRARGPRTVAPRDGAAIRRRQGQEKPTFFYHLGDVVYFNGLERLYGAQFSTRTSFIRRRFSPSPAITTATRTRRERPARQRKIADGLSPEFLRSGSTPYEQVPRANDAALRLLDFASSVRDDCRLVFQRRWHPRWSRP